MNFQLSPSCANLHHTINLPAWFYMCCYVRLTLVCTQCMFVYFHILHWKYNHSTLSFVSLTNVVYVTRNLSGKVLSNLGWVRAPWDSPAPVFMVSQEDWIKTMIAVSCVASWARSYTRPNQSGKMWRCKAENQQMFNFLQFQFKINYLTIKSSSFFKSTVQQQQRIVKYLSRLWSSRFEEGWKRRPRQPVSYHQFTILIIFMLLRTLVLKTARDALFIYFSAVNWK